MTFEIKLLDPTHLNRIGWLSVRKNSELLEVISASFLACTCLFFIGGRQWNLLPILWIEHPLVCSTFQLCSRNSKHSYMFLPYQIWSPECSVAQLMFLFTNINITNLTCVPGSVSLLIMMCSRRVRGVMIPLLIAIMCLLMYHFANPNHTTHGDSQSLPFRGREVVKGIFLLPHLLQSLKRLKIWKKGSTS